MNKRPTTLSPEALVAILTVSERVMPFCAATATDWIKAGVRPATAQTLMVRGLIEREHVGQYRLTDLGRAAWEALIRNGS